MTDTGKQRHRDTERFREEIQREREEERFREKE